jgi:plastocyanin
MIDRLLGERENNTMFEPNDRNTLHTLYDPATHSHSNHLSHSNPQLDTLKQYPRPSRKPRSRGLWGWFAFLTLVLLLVVGVISLGDSPNYFPPPLLQPLSVQVLFLIDIGAILVLALLQRIFWHTPLRKSLGWIMGLVLLTLVAVASLWSAFINPYASMTPTSFLRNSVSISNGETLHLQNPADGVTQILCIGVDQKCQPENGAPGTLNHGIRVQPGQRVTITFDTNGEYHITSETTPGMNLSVDVSTPADSGGY